MRFEPNNIYHIYNRGNNSQPIFFEHKNYTFFLGKIQHHLCPLVDVLAYCLMPNHFHLLVSVPEYSYSECDLESHSEFKGLETNKNIGIILSSYTRAINKKYNRTGSLFQSKTKAKNVSNSNQQAFICFHYIHQNPLKAKLVNKMQDWEFSSYRDYSDLSNKSICNKNLAHELLDIPNNSSEFINQSSNVIIDPREINIIF